MIDISMEDALIRTVIGDFEWTKNFSSEEDCPFMGSFVRETLKVILSDEIPKENVLELIKALSGLESKIYLAWLWASILDKPELKSLASFLIEEEELENIIRSAFVA